MKIFDHQSHLLIVTDVASNEEDCSSVAKAGVRRRTVLAGALLGQTALYGAQWLAGSCGAKLVFAAYDKTVDAFGTTRSLLPFTGVIDFPNASEIYERVLNPYGSSNGGALDVRLNNKQMQGAGIAIEVEFRDAPSSRFGVGLASYGNNRQNASSWFSVDAVTQPDGTRNVRFGILADDGRAKFLVDIPRVEAPDNAVRIVCNERDAYVEGPGFRSSLHVVGQTIFGEVQTDRGRMHPVQIPGVLARFDESADLRLSVFGDASRSVSLRADSVPNEAVNMARGGASMDKVVDPHTYGTLGLDLF